MQYNRLMLSQKTAVLLRSLADNYETSDFLRDDPSQFMHRFGDPLDQELFAFVAAQLAFGKRELFIAKLNALYDAVIAGKPKTAATSLAQTKNAGKPKTRGAAGERCHCPTRSGNPTGQNAVFARWLLDGGHNKFFAKSQKKFYRFFSYADMNVLCGRLAEIVRQSGSLGTAVRAAYEAAPLGLTKNYGKTKRSAAHLGLAAVPRELRLVSALISLFPGVKCVSQNPKGACKKLHMFLRWMVRQGSPVDLGLWKWASAADLLIPLDTHVLQESARLGLIAESAPASAKTAIELTQKMAQVFAGDPARADYALFGLGVDK